MKSVISILALGPLVGLNDSYQFIPLASEPGPLLLMVLGLASLVLIRHRNQLAPH